MTRRVPLLDVWVTSSRAVPRRRLGAYESLLSDDERRRHGRFRFADDRNLYLIAHAQLRLVLSAYADLPPAAWRFAAEPLGRPRIANPGWAGTLFFSLAHTAGLVAIAVSSTEEVGVDAESLCRRIDVDAILPTTMTDREARALHRAEGPADAARFLELWTLKEAYAKAKGVGLSLGLRRVSFEIGDAVRACFDPSLQDDPAAWTFRAGWPTPEHCLAVACRRPMADQVISFRRGEHL